MPMRYDEQKWEFYSEIFMLNLVFVSELSLEAVFSFDQNSC